MGYQQLLAYLYRLILSVIVLLVRMGSRETKRAKIKQYTFRIFKYEVVLVNFDHTSQDPLPRSGHRIVCDTRNLYSFGGYNPAIIRHDQEDGDQLSIRAFPLFRELWKFNFAVRSWERYSSRESLPLELASNAVIRDGNLLMVYGGTGSPFGYRCSNELYVCDLSDINSNMIDINTKGPAPQPQYGQALVLHNGYLYTIGGTTGFSYTCDIHRLNMKTLQWETVYVCVGEHHNEPLGRYRHEVAFDGQNIYIFGGGTSEDAYDFTDIPVFNLETLVWYNKKTFRDPVVVSAGGNGLPAARRCHGAVQIECDGEIKVFISGGTAGNEVHNDLWCISLKTFQWTFIDTCRLPYPTYFHSAGITPEGKMYIFGGIYAGEDIIRTNTIHSAWMCIPKLSEMCWEALLFYSPNMTPSLKDQLVDAGLPRHFAQRIEF